jgi:uncharacterized membrane protein
MALVLLVGDSTQVVAEDSVEFVEEAREVAGEPGMVVGARRSGRTSTSCITLRCVATGGTPGFCSCTKGNSFFTKTTCLELMTRRDDRL